MYRPPDPFVELAPLTNSASWTDETSAAMSGGSPLVSAAMSAPEKLKEERGPGGSPDACVLLGSLDPCGLLGVGVAVGGWGMWPITPQPPPGKRYVLEASEPGKEPE